MKKFIIIWIVGILVFLIAIIAFAKISTKDPSGLPSYATKNPLVKEAYLFAKENPSALEGINCYCGCMQHLHDGRLHSKGLHDCFLNGDKFEIHGSQCNMCINDALEVKRMFESGKSKEEISKYIDKKYS